LIKNEKAYLIENGRADFSADLQQTGSYNLFLDDSMFFYISMDLPSVSRRKMKGIISNYLLTKFPDFSAEGYGYVTTDSAVIIYIPSPRFTAFQEENLPMLRRASKITTPFMELCARENGFEYSNGFFCYSFAGGEISLLPDMPEDSLTADSILSKITPPKFSMTLKGVEKETTAVSMYKIPAIILLSCFIVFIAGEYLRLAGHGKSLGRKEKKLAELYRAGGVADKADPYGTLLYKARGSGDSALGTSVLKVFETLSKATDKDKIKMESLTVKDNGVSCTGTASDFQSVEEFKVNLEKSGGQKAVVEDTDKQGDSVKFVVRFEI
jgi:hypothetical protein